MKRVRLAPMLPVSEESTDGTGRLDVEYARTRLSVLVVQIESLASEFVRLKTDLFKLLDEIDAQIPADKTEPGL